MNCNKQNHWENIIIFGECSGSCGLTKGFILAEREERLQDLAEDMPEPDNFCEEARRAEDIHEEEGREKEELKGEVKEVWLKSDIEEGGFRDEEWHCEPDNICQKCKEGEESH